MRSCSRSVSQRAATPTAQTRDRVQHQESADVRGLDLPALAEQRRKQSTRPAARVQPGPKPRRQRLADFVETRMHVFAHVDDLLCLRAHFFAHAAETRAARLQVGYTDGVLVRHPQRQVASDDRSQCVAAAGALRALIAIADLVHAIEIEIRILAILIVDAAPDTFLQQPVQMRRKFGLDPCIELPAELRRRRSAGRYETRDG